MKKLTKKQKQHCLKIAKFFKKIPIEKIDQEKNQIDECGACVGAWLTDFYSLPTSYFRRGMEAFFKNMESPLHIDDLPVYTSDHPLNKLLNQYGASSQPFSEIPWPTHPSKVFKALAES